MPGIVGIITKSPNTAATEGQLSAMLECMLHEPFYTHGMLVAPEIGCHVGWVSHKDSFSDCNPIVNSTGDVVLIFSGEHFAHPDAPGGQPRVPDARQVLSMYENKGENFLSDLNGWFAGVLIDRQKKSAMLFNDRFGLHRIYYAEGKDTFLFASEAKAILAVERAYQRLDPAALGEFLSFGCVLQNRTLFSNVLVLPGGSAWRFHGRSEAQKRSYFSASVWENQPVQTAENFYSAFKTNTARVVPQYFQAKTGTAVSLTGGLDTRIIMAARPDIARETPCYTYGGVYRDCFDVRAAAEIAGACGLPHHVIPLGRDFFSDFATIAEKTVWLSDGCLDICGSHELYYSQRARQIAPIRITGNYGSEVLRSVSTFKAGMPSAELFASDMAPYFREASSSFADASRGHEVSFAALKNIPWHLYGRLAVAQSQLIVRSPYMDNELVSLVYQAPPALRKSSELSLRLITDLDPALGAIRTDMALGGAGPHWRSGPRWLYRYALFKAEWYYNLGMPRWLSAWDRALLKRFEPLFLGSHKIDHYRVWFRDQLAGYVRGMLSDSAMAGRPYLKRGACDSLLSATRISGRYAYQVSTLITLELIQKLLLAPIRPVHRTDLAPPVRI